MEIRDSIDFGPAQKIHICIPYINGYSHTEAFRECCERIEEEARRQSKRCTIGRAVDSESDLNLIFGAHLNPKITEGCQSKKVLLVNLERLKELDQSKYEPYFQQLNSKLYIDYSSLNCKFSESIGIQQPIYLYRPWHEQKWERIPRDTTKEWDACLIGSVTPRRHEILEKLRQSGLRIKQAFNCYSFERDEVLSKSRFALNIHAYNGDNSAELWRLNYLMNNQIPIISETCKFEQGEEDISNQITQFEYGMLPSKIIELANQKQPERQAYPAITTKKRNKDSKNTTTEQKPTILNIGCGNLWRKDAINIDKEETEMLDIKLDITSQWPEINQIHNTDRFGEIHLNENGFDAIEARFVLQYLENLSQGLGNMINLLKPGGWLYLAFPHQDSLSAWQDTETKRGLNENLFKFLSTHGESLGLKGSQMKLKWVSIKKDSPSGKVNKADKRRNEIVEAVLVKSAAKIAKDKQVLSREDTALELKKTGLDSFRQNLLRKSLIYTSTANIEDKRAKANSKTVSLLTPTFDKRFKFIQLTSEWINQQDYPKDLMEWILLTDNEEEASFLKKSLDQISNQRLTIRIEHCDKKLPIGNKRNAINRLADGDILINIDDDDYYFPNRVSEAVNAISNSEKSYELAGSQHLPILFLDDLTMWISNPGENIACAGSFAYRKSLLSKTWYPNKATNGEEIGFTDFFNIPMAQLDPFSTMVCIAHEGNTFDKRLIRKRIKDKTNNKNYIKGKGYEGEVNFVQIINEDVNAPINHEPWVMAYKNLESIQLSHGDLQDKIFEAFNKTSAAEELLAKLVSGLGSRKE